MAKKTGPGTAVATRPKQEVVNWEQMFEASANKAAVAESSVAGGKYLGTQGGEYSLAGEKLGKVINVIVLDSVGENAYYPEAFDSKNPASPTCFALGRADEQTGEFNLAPADDVPDKQNTTCEGCWADAFGTAKIGNGKACKNGRRLALIAVGPQGTLGTIKAEDITEAQALQALKGIGPDSDVAILKLSPTALKPWAKYVKGLVSPGVKRPPWGVITRFTLVAEGGGFKSVATLLAVIPTSQGAALSTITSLIPGCDTELMRPFIAREPKAGGGQKGPPEGKRRMAVADAPRRSGPPANQRPGTRQASGKKY